MATACIAQSALRVHGIAKPIIATFDQPQASSDGGAVLLKMLDDRLGLTWRLASAIRDRRQPGKVAHPLRDLLRQRVFGLACGYADCNDAARLNDDPIHKLLLERDPVAGAADSKNCSAAWPWIGPAARGSPLCGERGIAIRVPTSNVRDV